MSEKTNLAILEIKPEQAPVLYVPNGLDSYLDQIRQQVNEVPDLSTTKGRQRVASLAALVSRSKTAVEKPGRDYLRHLKEAVKPAEAELRRWVTECDALRDETRRPLTEREAEQERIKAEEQMLAWHAEALEMNDAYDKAAIEKFESDHEIALLLNDKFDRDAAEAMAEAERQRLAQEEELKRLAVEKAKLEAEQEAQRERDAAAAREAALKAQAEQAERARLAAEQKAERDKQEAIENERRIAAKAEADRLAEQKRIADEAAARAADVEHRRAVNNKAVADLIAAGVPEQCAISCVTAIIKGSVSSITITY
jgi:colicin import membrane protein